MQTSLTLHGFFSMFRFTPAAAFVTTRGQAQPRTTNPRALLTQVNNLSPAELCAFLASLALRHQADAIDADDSAVVALNILAGSVGDAIAPAQAERWALAWLDRDMSGAMRDVRALLAHDSGDGDGRFYAGLVRDALMLRDTVDRSAFVAAVRDSLGKAQERR